MLADTCPRTGCTMPLARSRSGRVVCTSCGLDVVLASASPDVAPPEDTKDDAAAHARDEAREEDDRVPNGMAGAVVVPAARARDQRLTRDAASAALGEKLLQGWTMLDAACERCGLPLLRDDARRVVCVGCQRDSSSAAATGSGGAAAVPQPQTGPNVGTSTQLMPRVLHVGSARGGGTGAGQVARAGAGERTVGAAGGRGGAGGGGSGVRTETRAAGGVTARLAAPPVTEREEEVVDVDAELWQAEIEAARAIKALRRKLGEATEVESCRVLGEAIYQLAGAIKRAREARDVGVRGARLR